MRGCHRARRGVLGPLSPSFDPNTWLADILDRTLTDQIAREVSGRYHVSVTRVYDGSNMIINQFSNKEELKNVSYIALSHPPLLTMHGDWQAVLASCFIPVVSGLLPPRYRGVRIIGNFVN